jgi:hypothetical protein
MSFEISDISFEFVISNVVISNFEDSRRRRRHILAHIARCGLGVPKYTSRRRRRHMNNGGLTRPLHVNRNNPFPSGIDALKCSRRFQPTEHGQTRTSASRQRPHELGGRKYKRLQQIVSRVERSMDATADDIRQ